MRRISTTVALLATGFAVWAVSSSPVSTGVVSADDDGNRVALRDDCDPNGWPGAPPGGGCALPDGDVTRVEFQGEVSSPFSLSVIGHQAWRNDPSYLKIQEGETVRVRNRGGRGHSLTKVEFFGGGLVTGLNQGLTPAPECAGVVPLPPGGRTELTGLGVGNHRLQCCFHPWMRMVIKVLPEEDDHDDHVDAAN